MVNKAIIAAAGSGKTELLIEWALSCPSRRVLITTYTIENAREIRARLCKAAGVVPENIEVVTWFEFLLRHGVKPYQTFVTDIGRTRSINFITVNPPFSRRADIDRYYFDSASNVYSDSVSDLVCIINSRSDGLVVKRLERIYDEIFIDEMQDLAGYDLVLLELLMKSSIHIMMVGDPRQAIYSTNRSNKYAQYRGSGIVDWIAAQVNVGRCTLEMLSDSYRCTQSICDLADGLYPEYGGTTSLNEEFVEHSGIFVVRERDVPAYVAAFSPQALRWDKRNKAMGLPALNFGQSKGLSFNRVLIFPTEPISNYLSLGAPLAPGSAAKLYVAITRARHSIAFVSKSSGKNIPQAIIWDGHGIG